MEIIRFLCASFPLFQEDSHGNRQSNIFILIIYFLIYLLIIINIYYYLACAEIERSALKSYFILIAKFEDARKTPLRVSLNYPDETVHFGGTPAPFVFFSVT